MAKKKAQAQAQKKAGGRRKGSPPPTARRPPPKIKPPVVTVRAGSQGERIVTVKWPDGAELELSARTEGDWHVIGSYPDRGLILDRVEVVPEPPQ